MSPTHTDHNRIVGNLTIAISTTVYRFPEERIDHYHHHQQIYQIHPIHPIALLTTTRPASRPPEHDHEQSACYHILRSSARANKAHSTGHPPHRASLPSFLLLCFSKFPPGSTYGILHTHTQGMLSASPCVISHAAQIRSDGTAVARRKEGRVREAILSVLLDG